jgi:hypothetical protein
VVVGLLELALDSHDPDLEAGPLQVFANRLDVRRPLPVEAQRREDADLVPAETFKPTSLCP